MTSNSKKESPFNAKLISFENEQLFKEGIRTNYMVSNYTIASLRNDQQQGIIKGQEEFYLYSDHLNKDGSVDCKLFKINLTTFHAKLIQVTKLKHNGPSSLSYFSIFVDNNIFMYFDELNKLVVLRINKEEENLVIDISYEILFKHDDYFLFSSFFFLYKCLRSN